MLSLANVRTASGAAGYFAKDNYYTRADADRSGEWFGEGAAALGLKGTVDARTFEAVLKGNLPEGSRVGSDNRYHRAGTDLTFSLPKSWSILALVGGDARILDAYASAVKESLAWAEKNLAETRLQHRGKEKIVQTGNLVAALFRHDTNRNQEPQAHIHAVIANLTRGPDGKWRALRNDRLWEHHTLLNAMAMARFRIEVEKLGYEIGELGKHGNFEALGVPQAVREEFSTRRAEVLEKVAEMASRSPAAHDAATLMTRAEKAPVADREALLDAWKARVDELGFTPGDVIARANARAATGLGEEHGGRSTIRNLGASVRAVAADLAERLSLKQGDPLIPTRLGNRSVEDVAAIHAVASAVRHLSEREAAFDRFAVYKTALSFGLAASIPAIEKRVDQLLRQGHLVRGKGADKGMLTTRDAIAAEQRILAEVEAGRGQGTALMTSESACERLQVLAEERHGLTLNPGQEGAGRMLLASTNRIVAIQGVAGAGKSTVLKPVAEILRAEGRKVTGLAVQNTLVQMLERETGIAAMSVARFLGRYAPLLDGGDRQALAEARREWKGSTVLLDEASMVGNADKEKLVRLANLLELGRFAAIGDRKQLGAVDAGKPFDVMQQAGIETSGMRTNIRARNAVLRDAQNAAQAGHIEEALRHLGDNVVEVAEGAALSAATAWLELTPPERERTAIYASGRTLRSAVNEAVQTGLKANGELGERALPLETLSRVNLTREELRHAKSYAPGMVVEVDRRQRTQHLAPGRYRVVASDLRHEQVTLENARGKTFAFRPDRLRPQAERDPLRLYEIKPVTIHAGDRIRWTETDHRRGLLNADQAKIVAIGEKTVTVTTSSGIEHDLAHDDPMLKRLDLAYALNAHMAQGLTSDRGIAVMDSREKNLSNQQTFLVTVTRLRDGLTLYVDNARKLEATVERNTGMKRSALETTKMLGDAAARGTGKANETREPVEEKKPPELELSKVKPFEIGI